MASYRYKFKWSFEEALEDWFEDNDKKGFDIKRKQNPLLV